jgi:leader peptidase (prepilin peptidase)/N-methyltransferase
MLSMSAMRFLLAGCAGAIVGTFLRAWIDRLSKKYPASVDDRLSWPARHARFELPKSWRRGVELVTAGVFVFSCWRHPFDLLMVSRLVLGCSLVMLFVIDVRHRVLPNAITLPGALVGLGFGFVTEPGWSSSLAGIVLGGGALLAVSELYVRVRGEDGLGMGDVKMIAMVGGFLGWKLMLVTLMVASMGTSLAGLALLVTGRGGMKTELPFGAFLAVGTAIAVAAGPAILAWYVGR